MKESRIYLSPPNVGNEENETLKNVIADGWISSVGPSIDIFEQRLEKVYSSHRILALNSGTSALHLSLILSNIQKGDIVLVSTFTFAASVNVILYQGAVPVFIDSEKETWNLDPGLLKEYLESSKVKPKAVIVTHLYGVPAQIDRLKLICNEHGILLIEDAAEAVGSTHNNMPLGSFGDFGILSFNGNKIITTSGGGALITNGENYDRGFHISSQANSGDKDYYHKEVGYNYRMSNVLAGIGIAQLEKINDFVALKRSIFSSYQDHLSEFFFFPEEPSNSFCNRWLTTPVAKNKIDIERLISFLDENDIESRRLWRPMHLQPIFKKFETISNGVSEDFYSRGLCLPSGTGLKRDQQDYVIEKILAFVS